MKIERIVIAFFAAAFIVVASTVYYAYQNFNIGEQSANTVKHAHTIIDNASQIQFGAEEIENLSDKYTQSHQPGYAREMNQKALLLNTHIQNLLDSVKNSSFEQQQVHELKKLASNMEESIPAEDTVAAAPSETTSVRLNEREELFETITNNIISKANEIINEEAQSLLIWRQSSEAARRNAIADTYYTGGAALIFILIILFRLNRGIQRIKQAETIIREREQRLRKMVEELGDVIFSADYKGLFVFINARLESLMGYTTDELIGKHFSALVQPDWVEKVKTFYNDQFINRVPETRFEFPIITKHGEKKWVEQTAVMVMKGKMVEGFQCVVRDITRRREVEEEIRRTNQFLDSVLENIPNTIFVKDAATLRYLRFNKEAEKLMGYPQEELTGKTDYDIFPKEQADFFTKSDREVLQNRTGTDVPEEPVNTAYGLRWVHTKKIPVYDGQNAPMYLLGISEDITEKKKTEDTIRELNKSLERNIAELKESQLFYRTVAHNFPDGTITVLNSDLNYIFVDGRELALEGLSPETLMGTSYLKRFPEEEREEIKNRLAEIFKGKETSFEIMLSGNYYILHGAPLRANETTIHEILLVKQNINKLKLAEENTKAALEKEKLINELKSRFVSLASHEFRTPLSTILSSTELIEEYIEHVRQNPALIKDKNIQHLKRIKSAIQNMVSILNNFLSLDQLEQGKALTNPQEFNIQNFSKELIGELQGILKSGQEIAYSHRSPNSMVYMDKTILGNVTSNLLTNAIKYSPENSVINYTTIVTKNGLEFSVEDHGIGIPQTEQANLFERFFRAKNTLNIEGTGLGLSIVKKYIDLLNGHISFISRENEGSIFKVFVSNAVRQPADGKKLIKQDPT